MSKIKIMATIVAIIIAIFAGQSQIMQLKTLKTREAVAASTSSVISVGARTCAITPNGGAFASSTPVQIKCGNDVSSALYNWSGEKSYRIINRKAETAYEPTNDKYLYINGRYNYKDWRGRTKTNSFSVRFQFKRVISISPNDITCAVSPAGGIFASSTPIKIDCGKNVVSALYNWSNERSYRLNNGKTEITYEPNRDKYLYINGRYKYIDARGRTLIKVFSGRYEFKKAVQPAPIPQPYYYIYPSVKASSINRVGYKITLPTISQVLAKFN